VSSFTAIAISYSDKFSAFFSETYGFKAGVGGLAYIGLGLGFFAATLFGAKFADQVYKYVGELFCDSITRETYVVYLAWLQKWRGHHS
jgi:hypothetical protein